MQGLFFITAPTSKLLCLTSLQTSAEQLSITTAIPCLSSHCGSASCTQLIDPQLHTCIFSSAFATAVNELVLFIATPHATMLSAFYSTAINCVSHFQLLLSIMLLLKRMTTSFLDFLFYKLCKKGILHPALSNFSTPCDSSRSPIHLCSSWT